MAAWQRQLDRGLRHLTALHAKCDLEFSETQSLLQIIEAHSIDVIIHSFLEIKLELDQKHEACKQQIKAARDQYMTLGKVELQGSAELLCESKYASLRFLRLMVENYSHSIADRWAMPQESAEEILGFVGREKQNADIERRISEARKQPQQSHADSRDAQGPGRKGASEQMKSACIRKQIDCLGKINSLLSFIVEPPDIEATVTKKIAAQCVEIGLAEKRNQNFEESIFWLQSAWDILPNCVNAQRETFEAGLALGELLGPHCGNYPKAQDILQRVYDIEATIDPLSEAAMQVSTCIAGVHYHSGNWQMTEEKCKWVLDNFSSKGYEAKHFWTTLRYLGFAYWYQDKNAEADTMLAEWGKKHQPQEELSTVLSPTLVANNALKQGDYTNAANSFTVALELAEQHFPNSELVAFAHRLLALAHHNMTTFSKAEEHYHRAMTIYETVSPLSLDAALNLTNMGALYFDWDKNELSEEFYLKAESIYQIVSPQSLNAANNLQHIGNLYFRTKQYPEAVKYYNRARDIYDIVSPSSASVASNHYNMGNLFYAMKQYQDAENSYQSAAHIYENVSPQSVDASLNLNSMGILYFDLKQFDIAENFYAMSRSIYSAKDPMSINAASNLRNIGLLYEATCRIAEAIQAFKDAQDIYARNHSDSDVNQVGNTLALLQKRWSTGS